MPRDESKTVVYKGNISKLDEKQIQILRMDPLRVHPILRVLMITTALSNIETTMHDAGAMCLMTVILFITHHFYVHS
jgi:hypothetical protein